MVGGFANNNYWSSTENDNNNAWNQNFNNGNQNNNNKNNTNYVRAIRGFKQNIQYPKVKYSKRLIPLLTSYLSTTLQLTLHPKKQYLQHYTKGVRFLGTVIKPNRIYIGNRTKGNFYMAIEKQNRLLQHKQLKIELLQGFLSSMNSYLGIMKHYKTYRLRMGLILKYLNPMWWKYVYLVGDKFGVKK